MKAKSKVNPKMVEMMNEEANKSMNYSQWKDEIELSLDIEKQNFERQNTVSINKCLFCKQNLPVKINFQLDKNMYYNDEIIKGYLEIDNTECTKTISDV